MTTMVNDVMYKARAPKLYKGDYVGLEIEVEHTQDIKRPMPDNLLQSWMSVNEGSLRNVGVEYISATPFEAHTYSKTLPELIEYINETPFVEDCPRTSTHIHANVGDMDVVDMWTGVFAYWLLENLLYKFIGPKREGNLFCLRLSDAPGILTQVRRSLQLPEDERRRYEGAFTSLQNDGLRYAGLNLNAIGKFGSVESRGMKGTLDKDEILTWMNNFVNIIRHTSTDHKSPADLMDAFYNMDEEDFIRSLLTEDLADYLLEKHPGTHYKQLVNENVDTLFPVAYCVDWNGKFRDQLKKVEDGVAKYRKPNKTPWPPPPVGDVNVNDAVVTARQLVEHQVRVNAMAEVDQRPRNIRVRLEEEGE